MKCFLVLLLCLFSVFSSPVLTRSDTFTVSGAADFDLPIKLYSDGDIRFLQWEDTSVSCNGRDPLFAFNALGASDRPVSGLTHSTVVEDLGEDVFGVLKIDIDGTFTWYSGVSRDFSRRSSCGVKGGSISWTVQA